MKAKTKIYFTNEAGERVSHSLKKLIRSAVAASLEYESFWRNADVSVTFTDNAHIRELNLEHRGIDRETDVLSFPLMEFERSEEPPADEPSVSLGDIVISLEKARSQAEEYGHSFEREVAFLCVHSMLHLLGYDHVNSDEEDMEMRRRQREILEKMGLGVK